MTLAPKVEHRFGENVIGTKTDPLNEAKKIKSDNFTRGNKEKSNRAIAILEKWIIGQQDSTIIISYFGGTNNIFADYTALV